MFAPAIAMTAPLPVVVMDADAPRRLIRSALAGVPAIATAIAGHISGRRGSHRGQGGRAGNGAQCKDPELHLSLHSYEVEPPFTARQTAEHRDGFRRQPGRLKFLLA